jgi:hypothetical protein
LEHEFVLVVYHVKFGAGLLVFEEGLRGFEIIGGVWRAIGVLVDFAWSL